jgi:GntR family transcriptional regulator
MVRRTNGAVDASFDSALQTLGPAAEQVQRRIMRDIAEGRLQPGQRLGAERGLAERFGVSRGTLRAALEALESQGVVQRVVGRGGGTFIADHRVERDLSTISVPRYLKKQGLSPGARVLSTATIEADAETLDALALSAGDTVFEIVRVRLADGTPISLERARLPADRFPGLLDHSLGGSLQAVLESEYGLVCGKTVERIEVVTATPAAAEILEVPRHFPLVSIVRRTVDSEGRPWELSHDLFRSDRITIVTEGKPRSGEDARPAQIEVMQPS